MSTSVLKKKTFVVTLAISPHRISNLPKVLEQLVSKQNVRPDYIFINAVPYMVRTGKRLQIPGMVSMTIDHIQKKYPDIKVYFQKEVIDIGPMTKLGPTLKTLHSLFPTAESRENVQIIVVDDDILYPKGLVEIYQNLLNAENKHVIYGMHGFSWRPTDEQLIVSYGFRDVGRVVDVIEGFASYCIPLSIMDENFVLHWASKPITKELLKERSYERSLALSDDLVVSLYLRRLGYKLKICGHEDGCCDRDLVLSEYGFKEDALHKNPYEQSNVGNYDLIYDTLFEEMNKYVDSVVGLTVRTDATSDNKQKRNQEGENQHRPDTCDGQDDHEKTREPEVGKDLICKRMTQDEYFIKYIYPLMAKNITERLESLAEKISKRKRKNIRTVEENSFYELNNQLLVRLNSIIQNPKALTPLVCILTPTYRRAHMFPRLIETVRHQTYANLCWLIVDDTPEEEIKQLETRSEDVKSLIQSSKLQVPVQYIYRKNHMSIGEKRNLIHDALFQLYPEAEIAVCFDDDDYHFRERITDSVRLLNLHSAPIVGCSNCLLYIDKKVWKCKFDASDRSSNGTFAYRTYLAKKNRYDINKHKAEEASFLNDFSIPIIEQDCMKNILVMSHAMNTVDKEKWLRLSNGANGYDNLSLRRLLAQDKCPNPLIHMFESL